MSVIGIIGAMEEEVAALKEKMELSEVLNKASMEFYKGTLQGKEVVVVRSGIGKVNAGLCTQILIDVFGVTHVINTGIAGSLDARIDIGDIVISTEAVQHDMDATQFGYPLGQIPRMETLAFPADPEMTLIAKESCEKVNPNIHVFTGRVVTGDQFVASKEVKERIKENFDGLCTEMEGGAIAQAAWLNQVPFVILRAISDKADDSAEMDYPTFERQAIVHSVRLTEEMIRRL